jgi:hypothetical protein
MLQGFLDTLAPGVVVAEGEEAVAMGQQVVRDGDLALGLAMRVGLLVECMLVVVIEAEVVEGDKMVGLGMVPSLVQAMARRAGMGLVVGHMLRLEAKVEAEVAVVDNMGALDPV